MPAASLHLDGEMDINTSQVKVSINEESKTVKVVIKGSNGTLHPSKHRRQNNCKIYGPGYKGHGCPH